MPFEKHDGSLMHSVWVVDVHDNWDAILGRVELGSDSQILNVKLEKPDTRHASAKAKDADFIKPYLLHIFEELCELHFEFVQ